MSLVNIIEHEVKFCRSVKLVGAEGCEIRCASADGAVAWTKSGQAISKSEAEAALANVQPRRRLNVRLRDKQGNVVWHWTSVCPVPTAELIKHKNKYFVLKLADLHGNQPFVLYYEVEEPYELTLDV